MKLEAKSVLSQEEIRRILIEKALESDCPAVQATLESLLLLVRMEHTDEVNNRIEKIARLKVFEEFEDRAREAVDKALVGFDESLEVALINLIDLAEAKSKQNKRGRK